LADQHFCAAIRMDIPPHAVSEIIILGPLSLQNVMMSHVMRHRFGKGCRVLAAEAADIAGHIGDLRGSLLLIDCGARAVERSLPTLPAINVPTGCILALCIVRQDSAHAQRAPAGASARVSSKESVDRIMDGVRRCLDYRGSAPFPGVVTHRYSNDYSRQSLVEKSPGATGPFSPGTLP
jgi:hypothetical protein